MFLFFWFGPLPLSNSSCAPVEAWRRNSLELCSYREPRKNILKINLLLLWVIFLCFFIGLFNFRVIFSQVTWRSAHNVKNNVLKFRTWLEKRDIGDNKSETRLFTLSEQTFSSQRVTFLKRSFIKRPTSGTSRDNEWQRIVQRMTTSDNDWYNKWQWVTTSGKTSDNKWQQMVQQVITNDSEWQQVTMNDSE